MCCGASSGHQFLVAAALWLRLVSCSIPHFPPVDAVPGISAAPSEENLRYFNVVIFGPDSSPYQGVNLG